MAEGLPPEAVQAAFEATQESQRTNSVDVNIQKALHAAYPLIRARVLQEAAEALREACHPDHEARRYWEHCAEFVEAFGRKGSDPRG